LRGQAKNDLVYKAVSFKIFVLLGLTVLGAAALVGYGVYTMSKGDEKKKSDEEKSRRQFM
jgi:hypothetical protein